MQFELHLGIEANTSLEQLTADPAYKQLLSRVWDVFELLEDGATDARLRRRRYQTVEAWGVPVFGSGVDWLVMWTHLPQDGAHAVAGVVVVYLGPDLGNG